MTTHESALATRCVHAGELDDAHGSPHTPVYTTTTFKFPCTADILDVVEGRKAGALYSRYGLNPTIQALEAKLAAIEGAEAALAFASGMAAEAAVFLTHGRAGIVCIGDAYGGTLELIGQQLPLLGIPTHFLLGDELDRLEGLLAQGPRLVFLETPSNPTLEVFDIAAIAAHAHAQGALLVVDNTFASPVNQQPLALGADLVVHSATKYLGGHSDLTAGALMGRRRCWTRSGPGARTWAQPRPRRPPPCWPAACAPWWCECVTRTPRRWPSLEPWRPIHEWRASSTRGWSRSPAMPWRRAR